MNVLFKKDVAGKLRIWKIKAISNGKVAISHGVYGGRLITKIDDVFLNSSGRDMSQQMDLEIQSRIQTQKDKGYVEDIDSAKKAKCPVNGLGLPLPMLAKPYKNTCLNISTSLIQFKYDGVRCLIHNTGKELIAYTRGGKLITSIKHITSKLNIPPGVTLDGELYEHNTRLQTILSYVTMEQPGTKALKYVVYDHISQDPFKERFEFIEKHCDLGYEAYTAPTWMSKKPVPAALQSAQSMGYEGLILRDAEAPYEAGKRSKGLVKVKSVLDGEFLILDISKTDDGWAMLHCEGGFAVTAPGTVDFKVGIYNNRDYYLGRKVRVEYAYLTADGIPFHPVATNIIE